MLRLLVAMAGSLAILWLPYTLVLILLDSGLMSPAFLQRNIWLDYSCKVQCVSTMGFLLSVIAW